MTEFETDTEVHSLGQMCRSTLIQVEQTPGSASLRMNQHDDVVTLATITNNFLTKPVSFKYRNSKLTSTLTQTQLGAKLIDDEKHTQSLIGG